MNIIRILLGLITLVTFGCGGGSSDSANPNALTSVTFSTDAINNTTTIGTSVNLTVTVKNGVNLTVPDGTVVNFTTTSGNISAASATTTAGVANVTLSSNTMENIKVTGSVYNGRKTISGICYIAFILRPVNLVAHRGYGREAPENTMAAFNRALTLGASTIEFDLRISSDGSVVIMHDPTVDRTTNGTGAVSNLNTISLRALDAGTKFNTTYAGEKIPLLSELIALAKSHPNIRILPEVKGYRTAEDIALMVQPIIDAGLESRTTFHSFNWGDLTHVRKLSSTVRLAFDCTTLDNFNSALTLAKADGKADIFIDYDVALSNPDIALQAAIAKVGLSVWTVDTWATIQSMQLSGVDTILSDWGLIDLITK